MDPRGCVHWLYCRVPDLSGNKAEVSLFDQKAPSVGCLPFAY